MLWRPYRILVHNVPLEVHVVPLGYNSRMSLRLRFILVIIFTLAVFAVDMLANRLYLYWTYSWFDSLMHLVGGVIGGYLVLLLIATHRAGSVQVREEKTVVYIPRPYQAFIGAFVIGVIWEIAEFALHISRYSPNFFQDTFSDLLFDIAGGVVAYFLWII